MANLETFRTETRGWLEANCPAEMRAPMGDGDVCWGGRRFEFQSDAQRAWLERCAERGFTTPTWDQDYGGAGLSGDEAAVLREEMRALHARPPLLSFGIWMLGPALLEFGSEAQKREHLPKIARGEIRWCQGYSEPEAGSDLASLKTKGVEDGDDFLVSGQKVWTSYADQADWIFCLVRTEPDAPKHKGISFLLFDMESPGVEARPITLISGASPFCETFFDAVRVPQSQVVGERGQGWTIAKYLLTHEREMIGNTDSSAHGAEFDVVSAAKDKIGLAEDGRLEDQILRAEIGQLLIDELATQAHLDVAKAHIGAGGRVDARSAELKYLGSELNKRRMSLLMRAGGLDALHWGDGPGAAKAWLRSKGNSIEGGTSEVMLSIVSKGILRLPNLG
ncbi:MAG: acyl-CoA dehydrogenase family protein [Pseudomonadota bacterium]